MLTGWSNVALVQVVQGLAIVFFVLVVLTAVRARLRLPTSRLDPLWDILLVTVLFIYALVMKIYFST